MKQSCSEMEIWGQWTEGDATFVAHWLIAPAQRCSPLSKGESALKVHVERTLDIVSCSMYTCPS